MVYTANLTSSSIVKVDDQVAPYFLRKICKYYKIPLKYWNYLTSDEVLEIVRKGRFLQKLRNSLDSKYPFCTILTLSGKTTILTKYKTKKIIKIFEKQFKKDVNIIRGVVANKGFIKGVVKIVFKKGDLLQIKKDQILVTPMTKADFMPYLTKISAIITDEGGVTCHAAIVSRELKIPCIISTKIATQVLKDGDLVEVDAVKGIIKKIKDILLRYVV